MNYSFFWVFCSFCSMIALPDPSVGQTSPRRERRLSNDFIDRQLDDAIAQIKVLAGNLPTDRMPRTFEGDTLATSNTGWWTSGFYPGTLLYLYAYSSDEQLFRLANQKLKILEDQQFNTRTHDVGFMMNCSFGNAMHITGDTLTYGDILVTGAESLISRYRPTVKAIRSWNNWTYPVIIDNMMNLELLFRASELSGNPKYRDIAIMHANTTMNNHFRPDYSCYHVVDYNPENGEVLAKKTFQGAFDESDWARGQAWALYGYTMMFRETGDSTYLAFAENIAAFILNHPNMPEDFVPYWDFDAPDLSAESLLAPYRLVRDAATAAILASALIELSGYVVVKESDTYLATAEYMLQSLASEPYKAALGTNGGFLLKHSVGTLPRHAEVDVPLTYADYYYVEALMRYRQ